jgi:multiple sugar transport system substrate-binding protein
MKVRSLLAAAATVLAIGGLLTGCTGSGSASEKASHPKLAGCTNQIMKPNAPEVSVWAWYPNMHTIVDNFNKQHSDVQVCWTNAGAGAPEYTKFQTAIAAGKGAPDVVMLEADHLTNYELQGALVDLSSYGANKLKSHYTPGSWSDVSQGGKVYAIPVDGGPMGLIYNQAILTEYGITTPPATWAEFQADAQRVKQAGGPYFADLAANEPATMVAYMSQKGAAPFGYDLNNPKNITINFNTQPVKDVLGYWQGLVKAGLVGTQDQFTSDFVAGFSNGKYATYPSAAWTPSYLSGAGVGKGSTSSDYRAAPIPQWDPSHPVAINWGGSTFAVTTQATDKSLAAKVAESLYADDTSLTEGWQSQNIFPLNERALTSEAFVNDKSQFFGGQLAQKQVYIPASNAYKGFNFGPFTVYFYDKLQTQLVAMNNGSATADQVAANLQSEMVAYAKSQGFTVK